MEQAHNLPRWPDTVGGGFFVSGKMGTCVSGADFVSQASSMTPVSPGCANPILAGNSEIQTYMAALSIWDLK